MHAGATNSNLYTVRVYRSPPQTVEDRIAIIVVSLSGSLYTKVRNQCSVLILRLVRSTVSGDT